MVFETKNGFEPGRRQFLQAAGLVGAEMGINPASAPKAVLGILAKLQAQSGEYTVRAIPFEPTCGEQSFPWNPAREDNRAQFNPVDQVEQIVYGSYAYSAYRGPSGDLIQKGAREEAASKPDGNFWVGWCEPASVAAWCLPYLVDREVLGIPITRQNQLYIGTIFCAYGLVERQWGKLTPDSYAEIKDLHAYLKENRIPKALVVNTSDYRGYPGQRWTCAYYGSDGDMVDLTDFAESNELDRPDRKQLILPYGQITDVKLIDPSQPQPGLENNYHYTLNRNGAKLCLGLAELVKI